MTDITTIANLCADRIADRIEMHKNAKKAIIKSDIAEDVARVLREVGIDSQPYIIEPIGKPYPEPVPGIITWTSDGTGTQAPSYYPPIKQGSIAWAPDTSPKAGVP